MHDEWFADEERVRRTVGLLENPPEMPTSKEVCIFLVFSFLLYAWVLISFTETIYPPCIHDLLFLFS